MTAGCYACQASSQPQGFKTVCLRVCSWKQVRMMTTLQTLLEGKEARCLLILASSATPSLQTVLGCILCQAHSRSSVRYISSQKSLSMGQASFSSGV